MDYRLPRRQVQKLRKKYHQNRRSTICGSYSSCDCCEAAKEGDAFYFVDGVHPQHNSHPAYGWFEKGVEVELPSNSGRQ
jgi:hypothetical protein